MSHASAITKIDTDRLSRLDVEAMTLEDVLKDSCRFTRAKIYLFMRGEWLSVLAIAPKGISYQLRLRDSAGTEFVTMAPPNWKVLVE
jgi:hypothetical protein